MLVLRTSNFQGATITPIVPRQIQRIVFIVQIAPVQKSYRIIFNFYR